MTARSPHEAHRASTPLELLFGLVFVVAIAQAASGLHHAVGDAHALDGLVSYLMVFFAIWWAVAIPVAVYLLCLWFLHDRPEYRQTRWLGPIAAVLVRLTPWTGHAVPLAGAILATLVAVKLVLRARPVDT